MKNFLSTFLAFIMIGGFTLAQGNNLTVGKKQYAGVHLGYTLGGQYGIRDTFGDGDLRFRATTPFFYGFGVGADVLFDISRTEIGNLPLQFYAGPGIDFFFYSVSGVDSASIAPGGVIGGELFFNNEISGYLEIGAAYNLFFNRDIDFTPFIPRGGLGVNFGF